MSGDLKILFSRKAGKFLIVMFLMSASLSCKNNTEQKVTDNRPGKNDMVDMNRYLVQKDKERIQNYIERKNLKMTESPTGLWFQLLKEGKGDLFSDNDKVVFNYECTLLDGTKCYSSDKLGPKELILGRSTMEPGLNEGLRLLKPGAEAIFIIPPFLGYGLPGDGKMIPSRAVIVYNVNILQPK